MTNIMERKTELFVNYTDPLEGFQGFLAIDCLTHAIAAGGFRVQKGLTADHICKMAKNMTLKQRIAGHRVDGAKSGIDYDPALPGKHDAIKRFFTAIRPYVLTRYSMGPDMNTTLPEINSIAEELDIPSVKMAIAKAQGLKLEDFLGRYKILGQEVDGYTLGKRRSGHGVAMACLAALRILGIPPREARVVIQGFGSLGAACAYSLFRAGVRIIAISDAEHSLICENDVSLDIAELLQKRGEGTLIDLEKAPDGCRFAERDEIFNLPCDIFIPAAIENAILADRAVKMEVKAVVEGANLPVSMEAEKIFFDRNIQVVPDFVAGAGGSISMDGLFGPKEPPAPEYVLDHLKRRMDELVTKVDQKSRAENKTPREVALDICSQTPDNIHLPPYGGL
jgi:glutamate dehydrogenase (NAD(P)+)